MKYEFSEAEVNALKELINLAVKAVGINSAEAGLILTKKLNNPIKGKKDATDTDTSRPKKNSPDNEDVKPKA